VLKLTFFIAGFEFVPVEIKDEKLLPKKKKKLTLKEKINSVDLLNHCKCNK